MKRIETTDVFSKWLKSLRDGKAKMAIQVRIDRLEDGHLGDCKHVGEDVWELRIHLSPGYRVYLTQRGHELIILLAGGVKSGQSRDIKKAIALSKLL